MLARPNVFNHACPPLHENFIFNEITAPAVYNKGWGGGTTKLPIRVISELLIYYGVSIFETFPRTGIQSSERRDTSNSHQQFSVSHRDFV